MIALGAVALPVAFDRAPSAASAADGPMLFAAVKPEPVGSIEIDPASITAGGSDVTITAVPDDSLVRAAVVVSDGTDTAAPTKIATGVETTVDVPVGPPDGPSVVTATLTAVDANGDKQAVSDTVWVDVVAGTPVVSTIGELDLQLKVIDARAANGLISAASAEVARAKVSGETDSIVSIQAVSECTELCIGGTVLWTDAIGGTHPVPRAPVEIIDFGDIADTIVTTVTTNDDGSFSAVIDNVDAEDDGTGRDVFVRVAAAGPGFNIRDRYIDSAVGSNVVTGSTLDIDLTANNVDDNNTAFSLQNAMVIAGDYVLGIRGVAFPPIDIVFPSDGSYYDGVDLHVLQLDRWDWDVMLHEYGHFISDELNIEANPGGDHSNTNLSDSRGSKAIGVPLAFGEGWPTYFAVSALNEMNTAALGIPNIGDTKYQDTEDSTLIDDLEIGEVLGEDNENTVMSILWDLFDSAADGRDLVALGTGAIWNTLDNGDPTTLSESYALFAPSVGAASNDVNCVFSQQNVAPTISGAASVSTVATSAAPAVAWVRGNGGTYANNQFEVQYRAASTGSLIHTSGQISATTYTPAPGAWATIVGNSGGLVNVTVIGWQTNVPATGPYRSCRQQLEIAGAPSTPGAPGSVVATAGAGQVVLSWPAPILSGGSAIIDYRVQFKLASAAAWNTAADGVSTARMYTVTGLVNGSAYQFRVSAVNAAGAGPDSPVASATPRAVPGAPAGLSGSTYSSAVALSWGLPTTTGGLPITDYVVQRKLATSATWATVNDGVSTARAFTLAGLVNGTAYDVRVAARNAAGVGVFSAVLRVTPRGTASAPTAVAAAPGNASVRLTWGAPTVPGTVPTSDYVVQRKVASAATWTTVTDGVSTTRAFTVTGLVNGTAYQFRVAAKNAVGVGLFSAPIAATPRTVASVPRSLSGQVYSGAAMLAWVAPVSNGGAVISDYVIQRKLATSATWTTISDGVSTAQTFTVTGLSNGVAYDFRVAARNVAGNSAFTVAVRLTPRGVPAPPTTPLAVSASATSVRLTWSPPVSVGTAPISDYVVTYKLASSPTWLVFADGTSTGRSAIVTGLTTGALYHFRIAARNNVGVGPTSAVVNGTPTALPTTLVAPS